MKGLRDLLFVSCTRGHAEETHLFRSLQKLGANDSWFFENNETGLPVCYNSVLDHYLADVLFSMDRSWP